MANYRGYSNLYDYIKKLNIPDGYHSLDVNGETIDIEMYNFIEDVLYDKSPVLGDDIPDDRMLVLKYHKNLTVNSGVTIIPKIRKKGMLIFVEGNLMNDGTISMTARGAVASGQDINLLRNNDGSFEYIPAIGASGGVSLSNINARLNGNVGAKGMNRGTGGGGSGGLASFGGSGTKASGAGGYGTSYSGGTGGGAAAYHSWNGTATGHSGSSTGGIGGAGFPNYNCSVGGGAGNPGGHGIKSNNTGGVILNQPGGDGTGGLLIIYTLGEIRLKSGSVIESRGIAGGTAATANLSGSYGSAGGGASGGGSINIFYRSLKENAGLFNVNGGVGGHGINVKGGAGGHGTATLTRMPINESLLLKNQTYVSYKGNSWILVDKMNQNEFLNNGFNLSDLNRKITNESLCENKLNNESVIRFEIDFKRIFHIRQIRISR